MTKVESLLHLRQLINEGKHDYFLHFGIAKSSKYITLDGDDNFCVYNEIDDTEETLNNDEILESNIGKFMNKGRFYCYD